MLLLFMDRQVTCAAVQYVLQNCFEEGKIARSVELQFKLLLNSTLFRILLAMPLVVFFRRFKLHIDTANIRQRKFFL